LADNLDKIANIRPWGTIILFDKIICDGPNQDGAEDGKKISCFTHIHDDHIKGLDGVLGGINSKVYSTNETKELASSLYAASGIEWMHNRENFTGLNGPKDVASVDGFDINFENTNHILGSGQLVVRKNEQSVCYSSDFMIKNTAIPKDIKYLILDATHGEHSESQTFDSPINSKRMIVEKVREVMDSQDKRINIHASRGTLQLAMSWLKDEFGQIPFFASAKDTSVAKKYTSLGHNCGKIIEDKEENFNRVFREGEPFIRFLATKKNSECELVVPQIASIKIGSTTSTSLTSESGMFLVNLQEHATVEEVVQYAKEVSPEHIVLDNSKRISGKDNATYLEQKIRENGFSVSVSKSPKTHPKYMGF